jgi:VWFA-related protein
MANPSLPRLERVVGLAMIVLQLLAPATAGLAQQSRFDEVAEVVLVEVPVQVLEDGEPVRGLTSADFEIVLGRKKQKIVGFDVVDLTLTEGAASSSSAMNAAARRHFLLLFDLSFSDPSAIVRAREAAIELVETGLHPTDLVGVATYSGSAGAALVLGFTPDRGQVRVAIETLGLPQLVESRRDPLGFTFVEPSYVPSRPSLGPGGVDVGGEILATIEGLEADIRRATDRNEILALTSALTELAEMLRSVDGHKNVVFLSEGFDSSILLGTSGSTFDEQRRIAEINQASIEGRYTEVRSDERFGETSTQNQLALLVDELIRADCAVQAIDIGGLRAGADVRPRPPNEDGLFIIANDTGGEFYRNFNNLNVAMSEVLERTSVTYVLAFQPRDLAFDGKYHKLKVQLKNGHQGSRLVHRPGFYAPTSYAEMGGVERQLTGASTIFGQPGGLVATAVLATPFDIGQELAYVPVLIEIEGPSLVGSQEDGVLPAEIYAYAFAADGRVEDFFTQALGLDLGKTKRALEQSGFKYWGNFDLPPGEFAVRVLVRNGTSGASGVDVSSITVPDFARDGALLLPPLFPEPRGKWLLGQEQQSEQNNYPYPYMLRDEPFLPAAKPAVRAGEPTQVALVTFNLPAAELEIRAALLDTDGNHLKDVSIVLEEQEMGSAPGQMRYLATCEIPAIDNGSYKLEVSLIDPTSDNRQTSSIQLQIVG